MATDIAPEILQQLQTRFQAEAVKNSTLRRISKRITDQTATLDDIHDYSIAAGEILSKALQAIMDEDAMPDGKIYWNIAERTIEPMIRRNYDLINSTAEAIQAIVDKADNLGLQVVKADYPEGRVYGLLDKIVEDTTDQYRWLKEPIVNVSESFSDDYMRANAEFRAKTGLKVSIVRETESEQTRRSHGQTYVIPCEWCDGLAGEYAYPGVPTEVFQRHESCRCKVTYKNERRRQNVWSKEIWQDATPTERLARLRG